MRTAPPLESLESLDVPADTARRWSTTEGDLVEVDGEILDLADCQMVPRVTLSMAYWRAEGLAIQLEKLRAIGEALDNDELDETELCQALWTAFRSARYQRKRDRLLAEITRLREDSPNDEAQQVRMLRDFFEATGRLPTADEYARFLRAAGRAEDQAHAEAQQIAKTSLALLAKHNPAQESEAN